MARLTGGRGGLDRPLWWLPYLAVLYVAVYLGPLILSMGIGDVDPIAFLLGGEHPDAFYWTFVLAVAILVLEAGWRLAKRVRTGGDEEYHVE